MIGGLEWMIFTPPSSVIVTERCAPVGATAGL
jgi:hypothetical protein